MSAVQHVVASLVTAGLAAASGVVSAQWFDQCYDNEKRQYDEVCAEAERRNQDLLRRYPFNGAQAPQFGSGLGGNPYLKQPGAQGYGSNPFTSNPYQTSPYDSFTTPVPSVR